MGECSCSIEVDIGGSAPDFFRRRNPRARIEHVCGECLGAIRPGETYCYETGMWEGHILVNKMCADCLSLRNTFFCSSLFGSLWDDFKEEALQTDGRFSQGCINLLTPAAKRKVLDVIKKIRRELHEVMDE